MSNTRRITGFFSSYLFLSCALVGLSKADDGWRRTSEGWEHISTWSQPEQMPARVAAQPLPELVHPLQLAGFQIAGSCLALAAFGTQLRRRATI